MLFSILLLSGCGGGGGYYMPWGETNTGYMTKDPDSIPSIAWQTPGQRQTLSDQAVNWQPIPGAPAAVPPVTSEEMAAPAQREKIIVSILVPLSGAKSALGQSMLKAAQMALFDIGSANFELVPRDTKSTPDGAASAARAAIAGHSALILGPVFADDLKAVKPIAAEADVPVVSFTTDWTLAGNGAYIMGFLPFTQVMRTVQYAQSHGKSRIAVFAPETEYADIVVRTLGKSGVSLVREKRYPATQTDIAQTAQDFVDASRSGDGFDFDALMLPLGSEGLRTVVAALNAKGLSQRAGVKFLGTGLWDDPVLMSTGALTGGWYAAPDPNLRTDFERRYQENYGARPLRLASLAYDATALAAVLARAAPDGDSAYTDDHITNPRGFAGIDGIFRFRPDGLSERGLAVLEVHGGGAKVIEPAPTAFLAGS
jgi:branched-chain amino acid transport system substrate-binding protein